MASCAEREGFIHSTLKNFGQENKTKVLGYASGTTYKIPGSKIF